MINLPVIRDTDGYFSDDCCPPPGGTKELHNVPRSAFSPPVTNSAIDDVLLDEAGIPILDEVTNGLIFDDLKNF